MKDEFQRVNGEPNVCIAIHEEKTPTKNMQRNIRLLGIADVALL
jgi:hypothetical protein